MKRKNVIFIGISVLLILIIAFLVINKISNKGKLTELNVNDVEEKINNKETFILCISKTTCTHCINYKPKLKKISKSYNLEIFYIDVDKYSTSDLNKFRQYISFDNSTPVTVFIKDGEEKTTSNRIFGDLSTNKIIEKFKSNGFIK